MEPRRLVEFVAQAARKVPESLQDTLRPELEYLFANPPPRAITVSYCYTGYTSEPSLEKAILRVEVKGESGFGTHIVKIPFAQRPAFWSQLTPGPVGDCGGRKKPASN